MGIHLNFCGINFLFKQFPTIFKLRRKIKLKRTKTKQKIFKNVDASSFHVTLSVQYLRQSFNIRLGHLQSLELGKLLRTERRQHRSQPFKRIIQT